MKVYITGLAGAAGSALVKQLLQKGYKVAGCDVVAPVDAYRLKDVIDQVDYQWKSIHDLQPDDLQGSDILADFSAQANTPLGLTAPRYTLWENLDGLINLLECARNSAIALFIYPSSGVIFGRTPTEHLPIKETEPPTPANPYAATKACSEILCMSYFRCYNLPVSIIRIGMGFGIGMRKDESIAQFIIKTLKGKQFWVDSPLTTRDPSYLENVLDAWMKLIEAPREEVLGEVFHISNGIEISILDLAKKCAEITAREAEFDKVPAVGHTYTYRRGELGMRQHLDISKAKRVLGWEPKISLEEGIRRTAKWLIEEGS